MFFFYHPEQQPKNLNYYKGVLFERILQRYLQRVGYEVELRQKTSSLEYDIVGFATVDGRKLVGEAKAHGRVIAGEVVNAFVGKLLIHQIDSPHLTGLFLSTSSLSGEAGDYLRRLKDAPHTPLVRSYSGDQLQVSIAETLGLPNAPTAAEAVKEIGVFPLSAHLLVTDAGAYILQISAAADGASPAHFSLIRSDGVVVADEAMLRDVQRKVPELGDLTPAFKRAGASSAVAPRREISDSLLLGNDWADYRLPAPPEFFVGRRAIAARILELLLSERSPGVVQIKSRSGVGKSSLMAFVASELEKRGTRIQLYDARNIKSVLDLWSVVQRFSGSSTSPSDFGEMERQLAQLAANTMSRAVLLIDQFESTFADAGLYDAFEFLAVTAAKHRPAITVVFARKNDLLTSFDDLQVSLDRLNSISESLTLDDFTADEAVELIDRISEHAQKPVAPSIKQYVLEFAQGFPWLLKRTMAHITRLAQEGESQAGALSAALRLDDLFDEEVEGLDEIERDYLVQIARRLPATYPQLESAFDEDPRLPQIVAKLTDTRLLRLSGSTYDTYNDVFKEYLVYRRLPDFKLAFVYRLQPPSVLPAFQKIFEKRRVTTEEISALLKRARGTTFNLLHELRALELIDRDGRHWVIPEAVVEAYERSRLGDYIRHQLMRNAVVSDLVTLLQTNGSIPEQRLPQYLESRLPFVRASASTWDAYASILLAWLTAVRLVVRDDELVSLSTQSRSDAAREVGNLRLRGRPMRTRSEHFLPGSWWSNVTTTLDALQHDPQIALTRKQVEAYRDLLDLGVIADGQLTLRTRSEFDVVAKSRLSGGPYDLFWSDLAAGVSPTEAMSKHFALGDVQPGTVEWRGKLLASWGRALGLVPPKATRAQSQLSLLASDG